MAKFSKGDKVESVKTGAKGVVDEVYGDEKYAVLFDGATNPDKVEGFQIKAANGCARNAKFKVGQKVKMIVSAAPVYGLWLEDGIGGMTGTITKVMPETEWSNAEYEIGGRLGDVIRKAGRVKTVAEEDLFAANSASLASTNAVVQNAINARTARNAGGNDNSWGREVDRLADTITKEFKKQAESYAYWIEADCGRPVDYLLRSAKQDKSVQPSIIAELERLRRRVNDAVAASKNLPR